MFCRVCGKEIEDNAQFCNYCGSPVEMEEQDSRNGQAGGNNQDAWNGQTAGNGQDAWNGQAAGNGQDAWNGQTAGNGQDAWNGQAAGNGQDAWNGQADGNSQDFWNGQAAGNGQDAWNGQAGGNNQDTWNGQAGGNGQDAWNNRESWGTQPDRNSAEWTEGFQQPVYPPEKKKKWLVPVCIAVGAAVLVGVGAFTVNMIRNNMEETKKEEWMKSEKEPAEKEKGTENAETEENTESAEMEENTESVEIKESKDPAVIGENEDAADIEAENEPEVTAQEEEEENLNTGMETVSKQEFQLSASSVLQEAGYDYNVGALLDMNAQTCWADGVSGTGEGESITFFSEEAKVVSGLAILPGFLKSSDIFYKNGMPVEIKITSGDKVWTRSFYDFQPNFVSPMDSMVFIDFGEDVSLKECTVTLTRCKSGNKYDDICITEMFLYKK